MAAKQFYDNTPIETSDVQRWENAASNGTPFYQIEPDTVSGVTISGTVFYKRDVDEMISSADYTFSADGLKDGDYCIRANPNGIAENVVCLAETYTSNLFVKLAYVTVSNGSFTDFRLVGDKYLQSQIDSKARKAEINAEQYAKKYTDDKVDEHSTDENAHMDIRYDISAEISAHNESDDAHDKRFSALQSQLDEKVPQTYVDGAINTHDTDTGAHGALFGSVNAALSGISGGLEAAVEKGNATADTVALLQKYPCYEYKTSGGTVQRFDDVSVIPHTIGVTVHGATDESGNYTVKAHGISANPNSTAVNVIVKNKTDNSNAITNVFIGGTAKTGTLEAGKEYQYIININSSNFNSLFPNVGDYITFKVQIEYGDTASDYEPAVEPQTVTVPITMGEGKAVKLDSFAAVSPTMMIFASDDNALVSAVDVTYNRDVKKALDKLEAAIAAQA